MTASPNENTYEERKQKFKLIREKLGPENPRAKENADRLLKYIQSGAIPYSGNYTPQEDFDRDRLARNYFLQLFFSVGNTIIDEDLSEKEAKENLTDIENASMPSGLPSDGSKGQWRTANSHKQKAYKWFLCEWDGDQF